MPGLGGSLVSLYIACLGVSCPCGRLVCTGVEWGGVGTVSCGHSCYYLGCDYTFQNSRQQLGGLSAHIIDTFA